MEFYELQGFACCSTKSQRKQKKPKKTVLKPVLYAPVFHKHDNKSSSSSSSSDDDDDEDIHDQCFCHSTKKTRKNKDPKYQTQCSMKYFNGKSYFTKPNKTIKGNDEQVNSSSNNSEIMDMLKSLCGKMKEMENKINELSLNEKKKKTTKNVDKNLRKRLFNCSVMSEDVAAVVIQRRFRGFLVRRSQTLRELQDLACVKSDVKEMKGVLIKERYYKFLCAYPEEKQVYLDKTAKLMVKLESIQGTDNMIRCAQKTLIKQVIELMEYLENIGAKEAASGPKKNKQETNKKIAEKVKSHYTCEDGTDENEEEEEFYRYMPHGL